MKNLSKKLISVIMALLFALAPLSSVFAIKIPWLTTYPSEKEIVETLGNFLKARDADGIAGMFNGETKSRMPDLTEKVESWLNQIECDIDDYTYSGSGDVVDRNYGYFHKSCSFDFKIESEDKVYLVIVTYIQAWTDDEQMVGLYSLGLTLKNRNGRVVDYLNDISLPAKVYLNYKETYEGEPSTTHWNNQYASLGYKKVVFESSDDSVAKIDENGVITATGRGTAYVTFTYVNEETGRRIMYEYDVTVTFTRWQWIIWYLFFGFLWY